jgi:ribosomal protein S18 acetylase RimI-like enzyme
MRHAMLSTIRTAADRDLPALESQLPTPRPGLHSMDLIDQKAGLKTFAVAWLSNRPVACGLVYWRGPRDPGTANVLGRVPELYRLEVQPEFRNRGIGTEVIRFLEETIRSRRVEKCCLCVGLSNPNARRLYARLGYSLAGVPHFIDRWSWEDESGTLHEESEKCEFLTKILHAA